MTNRTPAEVQPVSVHIQEEMQARGWGIWELAIKSILRVEHLRAILKGNRAVSQDDAIGLSRAFGTSPELWLRIDRQYRKWLKSKAERE